MTLFLQVRRTLLAQSPIFYHLYPMPKDPLSTLLKGLICLLIISTLASCSLQGKLDLVKKMDSKVPEASGLTLDSAFLYVVSDENGDIYKLDFEGKRVDRLKTKTKDVEGIAKMDNQFVLVDEANQKAYTYNLKGDRKESYKLKQPKIYDPQNGLEGIAYDRYTNSLMILNEKNSGQLLQFDTSFNMTKHTFLGSFSDYSGIATTKDYIWIISDEASGLAQYDRDMNLKKIYTIGIDSPEGIAIDEAAGLIYIVSDTTSELVVFKLPRLN